MKVVCIGAGRLADQLMPAMQHAGCHILQVYNRNIDHAAALADQLVNSKAVSDFDDIDKDAHLYFLTVSDDAIKSIADKLVSHKITKGVIVHCSGMMGLDVIPAERKAVFYPLQTFSEHFDVDWTNTPIIITSLHNDIIADLETLARKISLAVYIMSDEEKSQIHLAAVFANNFSNHMLTLAEDICASSHIPFDILRPLIRTTIEKAMIHGPSGSQTGPAARGDENTIEKHLQLLSEKPELAEVYKVVTRSIRER